MKITKGDCGIGMSIRGNELFINCSPEEWDELTDGCIEIGFDEMLAQIQEPNGKKGG